LEAKLFQLSEPVLRESGYELVWVEVAGAGGNRKACFFIDKQGGLNVEDCAAANRIIGPVIEEHGVFPGSYVLEVSSPGLDRPLFKLSDYERFTGRKVRIRLREKLENRRNFTGILRGVKDQEKVLIELDEGDLAEIPLQAVYRANLVFEWK